MDMAAVQEDDREAWLQGGSWPQHQAVAAQETRPTRVGSRLVLSHLTPQGLILFSVRVESVYTRVENLPRILGAGQVTYTTRPAPQ